MPSIFDSLSDDPPSSPEVPSADHLLSPRAIPALDITMRDADTDDEMGESTEQEPQPTPHVPDAAVRTDTVGNSLTFARTVIASKQLKPAEAGLIEDFARRPLNERLILMYATAIGAGQRQEDEKVSATASWMPSSKLEKNLAAYAKLVTFSHKIRGYRTSVGINIMWTIVKLLRFDIPAYVFVNPVASQHLEDRIRHHLTQARGALKKKLVYASGGKSKAEPAHHIYKLASRVCKGTKLVPTLEMCARLAILRAELLIDGGDDYWKNVDKRLSTFRDKYQGDTKRLNSAIRRIIRNDTTKYGQDRTLKLDECVASDGSTDAIVLQVEQVIHEADSNGLPIQRAPIGDSRAIEAAVVPGPSDSQS
ncbi:hypothetical protein PsYK624_165460 [Phanerochaete sordida]|uniref:Uncharacterized protein n=1 Tax=Phanerochaete sordida TaxID=48140 RepID=A0A9P3GSU4_9APHY|nr:hypothetical protein PsYK624_165460 [Phanerochaete sordida]